LNSFNDATNKEEENNQPPTFILSFDGVVANTAPTRASIAIEAALQTWPQLQENIAVQQTSDLSWLNNKIQALLHVTESSNEGLMGCEAVILARMLIEEQMLDEGRSIGKSGKYASKFHPTSENENIVNENKRRNKSGSRPLTVGEIAANWEANLVDSLFVKYNVNGKSPLPKIRKHLVQLVQKAKQAPPPLIPQVAEALTSTESKVYIIVTHPSQLELAKASLSTTFLSDEENQKIILVPPKNDYESQDDMIERLISSEKEGSSIFVVQSVLKSLVRAKRLLGDDSPRFVNGFGDSVIGDNIKISFSLPLWADNTDLQQHNDAIMNPWLDVMSLDAFLDKLGCKVPASSCR